MQSVVSSKDIEIPRFRTKLFFLDLALPWRKMIRRLGLDFGR